MRQEDLFLVEQHADFVAVLRARFPRATVVEADAASLTQPLGALRGRVDYVISGLPILWFNRDKKASILSETFELLEAGRALAAVHVSRPPARRAEAAGRARFACHAARHRTDESAARVRVSLRAR